MISTKIEWSDDPAAAPRGRSVERRKLVGADKEITSSEFVPDFLMAISKCGQVVRTYWIPARYTQTGKLLDGGRWSGFATGEDPVLWASWPNGAALIELGKEKADG